MKTVIAPDRLELGRYVAERAGALIRERLSSQASFNLVVATGSSQFEVLDALVQEPNIDWRRVNGFHLDEYLGVEKTHSASFCGYLATRFVDRIPLGSFHYLDGMLPPEELLATASQAIGGKTIDLLMCGIGENAHLAFNDPPADFLAEAPYLIVELDEACRRQQVGEGWFDSLADVPTQAISMSIKQILRADQLICSVPDRRKAEAVRACVEGDISPAIPASALRNHAGTTLVLDAAAASLLSDGSRAGCQILNPASNSN